MKNKLISKVIITICVTLIVVSMFNNFSLATGDNFDFSGFESQTASGELMGPVQTVMGGIISAVRIVFIGIAFIMIMYIGIKYISSAPEDRAEIKKSSVQFTIGALILFGSATILTFLEQVIYNVIG